MAITFIATKKSHDYMRKMCKQEQDFLKKGIGEMPDWEEVFAKHKEMGATTKSEVLKTAGKGK
jgi:hypothetical protein